MLEDSTHRVLPTVTLRPIDATRARAIISGSPCVGDTWVPGYPTEGDIEAATLALRSDSDRRDAPFCCYELLDDAQRTIGGAGFHGRPQRDGTVEIGYGIAPSARHLGFAQAAIARLVAIAADHGATRVTARTAPQNVASQRALARVGFLVSRIDDAFSHHVFQCATRMIPDGRLQ
jgi:RimJ/RimL family protein N-acetyltransferase